MRVTTATALKQMVAKGISIELTQPAAVGERSSSFSSGAGSDRSTIRSYAVGGAGGSLTEKGSKNVMSAGEGNIDSQIQFDEEYTMLNTAVESIHAARSKHTAHLLEVYDSNRVFATHCIFDAAK
jgi:hypothetical protein